MPEEPHEVKALVKWDADLEGLLKTFRKGTRQFHKEALKRWELDYSLPNTSPQPHLIGVYGISVSKLYVVCRHIQNSIPKRDHLSYAVFSRLLLEQTAMLWHLVTKIARLYKIPESDQSDEPYIALFDAMRSAVAGSRFDWDALWQLGFAGLVAKKEKYNPSLRQTNVLTWIQNWGRTEAYIQVLYDLLCDCVHPSMGSNMLFLHFESENAHFGALQPSPLGDLMMWNSLEQVLRVQERALRILNAMRVSIERGRPAPKASSAKSDQPPSSQQ